MPSTIETYEQTRRRVRAFLEHPYALDLDQFTVRLRSIEAQKEETGKKPHHPNKVAMPTYEETRSKVRTFLENPHVLAL